MVTDWVLLVAVILGVALTVGHFFGAMRGRRRPELASCMALILAAFGIMMGVKVCLLALDASFPVMHANERLYVFMGGVAVVWTALEAIVTHLPIPWGQRGDEK